MRWVSSFCPWHIDSSDLVTERPTEWQPRGTGRGTQEAAPALYPVLKPGSAHTACDWRANVRQSEAVIS